MAHTYNLRYMKCKWISLFAVVGIHATDRQLKQPFFSKICFGNPPQNFLRYSLNSEPLYSFKTTCALKKKFSAIVEVTNSAT
jgi:hypothetical protein